MKPKITLKALSIIALLLLVMAGLFLGFLQIKYGYILAFGAGGTLVLWGLVKLSLKWLRLYNQRKLETKDLSQEQKVFKKMTEEGQHFVRHYAKNTPWFLCLGTTEDISNPDHIVHKILPEGLEGIYQEDLCQTWYGPKAVILNPLCEGDTLYAYLQKLKESPPAGILISLSVDTVLKGSILSQVEQLQKIHALFGIMTPVFNVVKDMQNLEGFRKFAQKLPAEWLDKPFGGQLHNMDLETALMQQHLRHMHLLSLQSDREQQYLFIQQFIKLLDKLKSGFQCGLTPETEKDSYFYFCGEFADGNGLFTRDVMTKIVALSQSSHSPKHSNRLLYEKKVYQRSIVFSALMVVSLSILALKETLNRKQQFDTIETQINYSHQHNMSSPNYIRHHLALYETVQKLAEPYRLVSFFSRAMQAEIYLKSEAFAVDTFDKQVLFPFRKRVINKLYAIQESDETDPELDPKTYYDYLSAHLMLNLYIPYNPVTMETAYEDWVKICNEAASIYGLSSKDLNEDVWPTLFQAWSQHYTAKKINIQIMEDVVERAQIQLRKMQNAEALYNQFKKHHINAYQNVSFEKEGNRYGSDIIDAKQSLSSFYTLKSWQEEIAPAFEALTQGISESDPTLYYRFSETNRVRAKLRELDNLESNPKIDQKALLKDLQVQYFADYAEAWQVYLKGIRFKHNHDLKTISKNILLLSKPDGPFAEIFKLVQKNMPQLPGNLTSLKDGLDNFKESVADINNPICVDELPLFFSEMRTFMGPFIEYQAALKNVHQDLEQLSVSPNAAKDTLQYVSGLLNQSGQQGALYQSFVVLDTLLQDIQDREAKETVHVLLLSPILDIWENMLSLTEQELQKEWEPVYAHYRDKLALHFPLSTNGKDASVKDFMQFFSPDTGLLAEYSEKLKSFMTVRNAQLEPKKWLARGIQLDPRFEINFMNATHFAQSLFGEGQRADFVLSLMPVAKPNVKETLLEYKEQSLKYRNEPPEWSSIKWTLENEHTQSRVSVISDNGSIFDEKEEGPWSLLHLLHKAKLVKQGDSYEARFRFAQTGDKSSTAKDKKTANPPLEVIYKIKTQRNDIVFDFLLLNQFKLSRSLTEE